MHLHMLYRTQAGARTRACRVETRLDTWASYARGDGELKFAAAR